MNNNENLIPSILASTNREETVKTINELIAEYDTEIGRQRANSKIAYKGIILTLVLCIIVFLMPNFSANTYEQTRKNTAPIQDSIIRITDSQNVYKQKLDACQKRFNDIRILQNKYATGLDTLFFQIYVDDPIFSNLLYSPTRGLGDSSSQHIALVFGGEIPFTSLHKPLNNTVTFVKLNTRDTMQDRNYDLFRDGIAFKQKTFTDSIIAMKGRKESNIANNRNIYEIVDVMSVRLGAIAILIFMVTLLGYMMRYYNRLAQYYVSRRNGLKLHLLNDEKLSFENVVNLLSPDHIEMKLPQYFGGKSDS